MDTFKIVPLVLWVIIILEVIFYCLQYVWSYERTRRATASVLSVSLALASTITLVHTPTIFYLVIWFICLYQILNLLRVIENRANLAHQLNIVRRTIIVLAGLQLLAVISKWILAQFYISHTAWFYILALFQLGAASILLASTTRRMKKTGAYVTDEHLAASELPTVTVAIPARNETEILEESLRSVIASDYPKLEILVLDDCSQTRRTPEIIRSFAHDGVRFLKGKEPKENWLAKNQAYDKLAEEASGELMLFCGVDIRLKPDTIRKLVTELIGRQKRMMSVVPLRARTAHAGYSFVQAARYLWELTPPRRLFNRPPVLSSCWLIYSRDLRQLGGFDAVSRMVIPEAYFAKKLLQKDGYSFLRAEPSLGLTSVKSVQAQQQTAIRTRYPQLHRRPENVMLLTIFSLACFVGPVVLTILGLSGVLPLGVGLIASLSFIMLTAVHMLVAMSTGLQRWYVAIWSFLPVAVADIGLMHVSMQRYEFSEVLWKGRNVCIPVMHVYPSLPKI